MREFALSLDRHLALFDDLLAAVAVAVISLLLLFSLLFFS